MKITTSANSFPADYGQGKDQFWDYCRVSVAETADGAFAFVPFKTIAPRHHVAADVPYNKCPAAVREYGYDAQAVWAATSPIRAFGRDECTMEMCADGTLIFTGTPWPGNESMFRRGMRFVVPPFDSMKYRRKERPQEPVAVEPEGDSYW